MNDEKKAAYAQIRTSAQALRQLATSRAAANDLRCANLIAAEEFRLLSALAQLAAVDAAPPSQPSAPVQALAKKLGEVRAAAPPRIATEAGCFRALADRVRDAVAALGLVDRAWDDLIDHRRAANPEHEDPAQAEYPGYLLPDLETLRRTLTTWEARLRMAAAGEVADGRAEAAPSFGSEHEHPALQQADGQVVEVVEEVRKGLFRTTFQLEGDLPESDYASGGYLLIMPDRDGVWTKTKGKRRQ